MRIRPKRNSLATTILKKIALAGLVVMAASSPYFGLGLITGLGRHSSRKTWRKFYASLNYLDRRGYVEISDKNSGNGKVKVKITRMGEKIVDRLNTESLKIPKKDVWDGKWRVVMFDIPNTKSRNRLAFTEKLKELGFIMVQKSVWAYPFECYKEVAILRKFYEIEKFVTYVQAIEVEDELDWRGKFNLKGWG